MTKRLATLIVIFAILGAGIGTAFVFRVKIKEAITNAVAPKLPAARPYVPPVVENKNGGGALEALGEIDKKPVFNQEIEVKDVVDIKETETEEVFVDEDEVEDAELASSINLSIPFTPQAPHANWNLPYQEACEESSLIMVNAWMVGVSPGLIPPDEADQQILKLVDWQMEKFGYFEDTTAEETAVMAREYYGYKNTKVVPVTSIQDVRDELAAGSAVILPAAGHKLGNPYFRGLGPLYHMIVAKGYTEKGGIITNDPGTRRGENYIYDPEVLFEALGDWNGGDPAYGDKLMIILAL